MRRARSRPPAGRCALGSTALAQTLDQAERDRAASSRVGRELDRTVWPPHRSVKPVTTVTSGHRSGLHFAGRLGGEGWCARSSVESFRLVGARRRAGAVALKPGAVARMSGKLVPRLQELASPSVARASTAVQGVRMSLPVTGPGSLIRIGGQVV